MKYVKLVPAALAISFALLSFTPVIDRNIAGTFMMLFLGISHFVLAKENFVTNRKMAYLNLFTGGIIFLTMLIVFYLKNVL